MKGKWAEIDAKVKGEQAKNNTAYLYTRKILYSEVLPSSPNASQRTGGTSSTGGAVDFDANDDSQTKEIQSSPHKRRRKSHIHPSQQKHQVHCYHCSKSWGPYPASYTTTAFTNHFRKHHMSRSLPADESEEKGFIVQLKVCYQKQAEESHGNHANKSNSWTIAKSVTAGARKVGERFDLIICRTLLVRFVLETNSPLSIVESPALWHLLAYCNGSVEEVSRRTLVREIQTVFPTGPAERPAICWQPHRSNASAPSAGQARLDF
ncbi:hypothetical protein BDD12DRAFT_876521 [Trichophaea hybrida]|nr:hypothetical protein BDD12DRAFT_876521 [Trichophaea hybrida]